MTGPALITCPHCGKETAAGDACRHCGRDSRSRQDLEVEYKDFRGSEMLDIKMSSPVSRQKEISGREGAAVQEDNPQAEGKSTPGKVLVFFGAALLIVVSVLGWYYLLKFFLKF
ncbi:MAG: hypothetical protein ACYC69_03100 [Thermodesulfovibrionales bacterium]